MKPSMRRQKTEDRRQKEGRRPIFRLLPTAYCLLPTIVLAAPATHPAAAPMPSDFAPLLSRSIFVKGRSSHHSTPPPSTQPHSPAAAAESVLVLNGVTKTPHELTAFIEDRSTGKVTPLRLNDSIARGKVVGITLDALSYEADGRVVRVAIGDNLQGQTAPKPSSRPTSGASSSGAATAPSPQMQSILERMRLKRQQELKHK